jgi:hypothetical protein
VHAIAVVPTLNWEPDFGVHCTATGDAPPLNVGAANSTLVFPAPPVSVTGAITGQLIVSGGIDGDGGGGGGGSTTGASTTTVELHDAVWSVASAAVHEKLVLPTAKSDPDAGEQVVVTGAVPPLISGRSVTAIAFPSGDVRTGEGHAIETGTPAPATNSADGAPSVPFGL